MRESNPFLGKIFNLLGFLRKKSMQKKSKHPLEKFLDAPLDLLLGSRWLVIIFFLIHLYFFEGVPNFSHSNFNSFQISFHGYLVVRKLRHIFKRRGLKNFWQSSFKGGGHKNSNTVIFQRPLTCLQLQFSPQNKIIHLKFFSTLSYPLFCT